MHALLVLLGCPIAFFVSVNRKNPVGLALIHLFMGWIYVAYVAWRTKFYDGYQQFKDENK